MRQMTQSPEWRKDLKDNLWENTFLNSDDTRKYLDAQYAKLKEALTALGLAR